MEEKKKYKRYSIPVKILILLSLIASTVVTGLAGSWMMVGLGAGMTFRELMFPVPFEESREAGNYLTQESHLLLNNMLNEQMESVTAGSTNEKAWLIEETEETNVVFYAKNMDTHTVYTNVEEWGKMSLQSVGNNYQQFRDSNDRGCFYVLKDEADAPNLEPEISDEAAALLDRNLAGDVWGTLNDISEEGCSSYQLFVGLDLNYPARDSWSYAYHQLYQTYQEGPAFVPVVFFAALGIMIVMLVLLGRQAGHNSQDREIHLKLIDRFPIEAWIVVDAILVVGGLALLFTGLNSAYYIMYWNDYSYSADALSIYGRCCPLITAGLMILSLTAAKVINLYGRRIKARTLDGSVFLAIGRRVIKWFRTLYDSRKENQKLLIRYVVIFAVNLFLLLIIIASFGIMWAGGLGFFFLLVLIVVNIFILYRLVNDEKGKDEIKVALREISQGNLDYQIDMEDMSCRNQEMAREVNQMRDGLKKAVETQLKSERLKTDLIANVSHDIKTPLTSIINYVDILDRENFEDERIAGYVDILVRKSARLKQLTDDLIEASKISSGNITLDMQDINLKQLIKQTNGEFEEKFEARHLQLVCTLPEENLMIRADGRRMYRVLENLYNNASKYAMPYSRVYVDGENQDDKVIFSIKNMSEHPLNISADELMERFVRGDSSRTTEGNGLGLEIARNLTVMQNGKFDLYLDGDLFKVVIIFGEKEEKPEKEEEAAAPQPEERKKKRPEKKRKSHIRLRFKNPVVVEKEEDGAPEEEKRQ